MPFLVIATIENQEAWCEVTPPSQSYPFYQEQLLEMNGQTFRRHDNGTYSLVVGNQIQPVMEVAKVYILTGVLDSVEAEEEEPGFHRVYSPYISQTCPVMVVKLAII